MHATPGAKVLPETVALAEPSRSWLRRNFLMSYVLSAVLQMILQVLWPVRAQRGWALMRSAESCDSLLQWLFARWPRLQMEFAKCSTPSRCVHEPPGIDRREFGSRLAWPAVWGQRRSPNGLRGWSGLD